MNSKAPFLLLFFLLKTPLAFAFGDQLGLSPFWDWKTIETEHFRVTFPSSLEDTAQRSAHYFEEAHQILSPKLYWSPPNKTQILVIDNSDLPNGLASASLRFGVILMVAPPDSWLATQYSDDWLRMLVFHEYVHILNLDAYKGWMEALRVFFGDIIRPNSLWPTWMVEGLAVYFETRQTKGGRGRSTYYEMVLRSAVEEGLLDNGDLITLDKLNGRNTTYPGGRTPYLYGYQLVNQIAKDPTLKRIKLTRDYEASLKDGEDALGLMSYRSGGRIPFFINGNLENITGKDWYDYWDTWVAETRKRMTKDLSKIRSHPLTKSELITRLGYEIRGVTVSPNERLIAYHQDTPNERSGLHIFDTQTSQTTRITDKLFGGTMSFSNDSRYLYYSSIERHSNYYRWSDLALYDTEEEKVFQLTEALRAKDPSISPNGKQIVFSINKDQTTHLAVAQVHSTEGSIRLKPHRILFSPEKYGKASSPTFSPDGESVVFSYHPSNSYREDIVRINIRTGKKTTLVKNGSFNRFPTFDHKGRLHFTSDVSGVDNVFRLDRKKVTQRTNTTSGILFPSFSKKGTTYAAVYSARGWNLAKIRLSKNPISTSKVKVSKPPAPESEKQKKISTKRYQVKDYSVFPSIWPRNWTPILIWQNSRGYLGGQIAGFDAVDRHRYGLLAGYDTLINAVDSFAVYRNRTLGPSIQLRGSYATSSGVISGSSVLEYTRKLTASVAVSFPFQWTWSTLTPKATIRIERDFKYQPTTTDGVVSKSPYVPEIDFSLNYANPVYTARGVSPEGGRFTTLGYRVYFDSGYRSFKGIFKDVEHIELFEHWVLSPSLAASWTSRRTSFDETAVQVRGRYLRLVDQFPTDNFDHLGMRGYPNRIIRVKSAAIGSLDLRFPIWIIERGWGTHPFFLEDLEGGTFVETTYFPNQQLPVPTLPSAGAYLKLNSRLLTHLPFSISLEYHKGFRESEGGQDDLIVGLSIGTLPL